MRGERGFALLAALWLLVALSAIGLQFSLTARERRLMAGNATEELRARTAAQAGIEHARARLDRLERQRVVLDGAAAGLQLDPFARVDTVLARSVEIGEARYRVSLRDAGAALQLNLATEQDLRRFLNAYRIDAARAEEIAQSILDWRDGDDLRRGRGAERAEYLRANAPVTPRNAPFASLGELRHVRGVTPELYTRIASDLTLMGNGTINLNTASRPVLLSLPGMTEEAADVLLRWRLQGRRAPDLFAFLEALPPGTRAQMEPAVADLFRLTTTETAAVEVRSSGWVDGGRVRIDLAALLLRAGGRVEVAERRSP